MPQDNMQALLERASETGARRALSRLGLDDASAAKDMGESARIAVRLARCQAVGAQGGDWLGGTDDAGAAADRAGGEIGVARAGGAMRMAIRPRSPRAKTRGPSGARALNGVSSSLDTNGEGENMRLAGYAAIFDAPDRGGDIVRKGAFVACC